MKTQKLLIFLFIASFYANTSFAAVSKKAEESKLIEELTGKKAQPEISESVVKPSTATMAVQPISRQLLNAGFYAFTKKDYISALKHYNTIIVKYPKSNELQLAYLAKSKMYQEMGLIEQAQFNLNLANKIGNKTQILK